MELTDGSFATGSFTPAALANCTSNCGFSNLIDDALPRPRVRLTIGTGVGAGVGAFQLELSYADTVIDILDAYEEAGSLLRPANAAATVWFDDDGLGNLRVSGVAHPTAPAATLGLTLEVVFGLDDPAAQILDLAANPNDVQVSSIVAYDLDGNVIPGAVATIDGIR